MVLTELRLRMLDLSLREVEFYTIVIKEIVEVKERDAERNETNANIEMAASQAMEDSEPMEKVTSYTEAREETT